MRKKVMRMTSENVLHIGLDGKEYDALSAAILILGDLEDMLRGNEQYEYTRDLYHETRCSLLRIQNEKLIADSGNYQIAPKSPTPSAKALKIREHRIKELGEKLYKFAEETETLYDPYRDDKKPTLKEFSANLYTYKRTAYLMESLLQGMDDSEDDLPKYYDVMMDMIHHMECLEKEGE